MIDIHFDKLYRYPRIAEPCYIGIPVKKGELMDLDGVSIFQEGQVLPIQKKVTSRYKDGSIRFMFLRFMPDLPANKGTVVQCDFDATKTDGKPSHAAMKTTIDAKGISVDTQVLSFRVENNSQHIFSWLKSESRYYEKEQFTGPLLKDGEDRTYSVNIGKWEIIETGEVCTILRAFGSNVAEGESEVHIDFELKLIAYTNKPWVEVSYRIINTTSSELHIASLVFYLSCGNKKVTEEAEQIYHTSGVLELEEIEKKTPVSQIRTCVASSNYKTNFEIGVNGATLSRVVDADYIVREANEHFAEVFYGTFFADYTDETGGICATIFQAQQNYPKAVSANRNGIAIMLVPEGVNKVVMQSGMSREQKFLLHFHKSEEMLKEIDNRSLIYQMPDRPYIKPEVHKASGVYPDIFPENINREIEQALIAKADGHARCYGMLNFGDAPDMNYTTQGRGGGELVWTNNEYDFPHACALQYVRTGIRRFMDYNIAACSHWMDVDVCHYSDNPLFLGGQWEHTNGHCKGNVRSHKDLMVCSHQWVEGLLDYYHLTGDERGKETALGIGENILRLLDTPMYAKAGEINARETGWALRSLTALYVETGDDKWLAKSHKIIEDFKVWEEQYGDWLAPYTDNTVIRVGFMISVAVGSLMRYYREFPDDTLKEMILKAVDDLIENCYMDLTGLFYYKELPSLNRLGNNPLLLESLAIAYELTGDKKYLLYGERTFELALSATSGGFLGKKTIYDDTVVTGSGGTKGFAQSFIPLVTYYKAICK